MRSLAFLLFLLICFSSFSTETESCALDSQHAELLDSSCEYVTTYLDYSQSNEQTIELFVRKFPTKQEKRGTVWLIAGGPGESGANLYPLLRTFEAAFPGYDLLIPDHRGTGASSTICPGEALQSQAGTQLVGEEWGACFAHMYSNLDYVKAFSITNAANDLAKLIEQFSTDGKTYIYAVSYGTQLTLRLMQLGRSKVDGIILDSLVPMQTDPRFDLSQRSSNTDEVGRQVLSACDAKSNCNQIANISLTQQLISISQNKDVTTKYANLPLVLAAMLDVPELRNQLPKIIQDAYQGNTESLAKAIQKLETFYSEFNHGYSNFGSSVPLVQVISASENNLRPDLSKADIEQEHRDLLFHSPIPGYLASNNMPSYARDEYYQALPAAMPKTLVLHGSLDPKTPFPGAKKHVQSLSKTSDIELVKIKEAPHFVALFAQECFVELTQQFVLGQQIKAKHCVDKSARLEF